MTADIISMTKSNVLNTNISNFNPKGIKNPYMEIHPPTFWET